jgi:hypothetical protein
MVKPVLRKRAALMRWSGWSKKIIAQLVKSKKLKVWRGTPQQRQLRPNRRALYYVDSAERLLRREFPAKMPIRSQPVLIKRAALIKWSGWAKKRIARLVKSNKLEVWRCNKNGRALYYVDSAEQLLCTELPKKMR